MWENCRLYNPVGHLVRQMGDRLSETWEKKWHQSGIEARWEGLMRELTEEEVPLPPLYPPSLRWAPAAADPHRTSVAFPSSLKLWDAIERAFCRSKIVGGGLCRWLACASQP